MPATRRTLLLTAAAAAVLSAHRGAARLAVTRRNFAGRHFDQE